jgi:hypothetical protein
VGGHGLSQDTRFRILDYQRVIGGAEIVARRSILWPCHAIKVVMPALRKRSLNIFEETVLRFAGKGKRDVKELSSLTCLEGDLLEFILSRLKQNGMLDERRELTGHAKEYLKREADRELAPVAVTVFVDLVGGTLLPVILGELPSFSDILEIKDFDVRFRDNYSKHSRWARKLTPKKRHSAKIPAPDEVAKIAEEHKRLHKRYALLSKKPLSFPQFKGVASAITVSPGKDLIYLHTELVIQKGEFHHEVTDPFGYGFSERLVKVHREYVAETPGEEERVENLRKKARTEIVTPPPSSVAGFKSFGRHEQVRLSLTNAEKAWDRFSACKGNWRQVEISEREKAISDCAAALYASIEWAFRELVSASSTDKWIDALAAPGRTYEDNRDLLGKLAKKIGIEAVDRGPENFLAIGPGKFRHAFEGDPEMEPLIGFAIAQAAEDGGHPLNEIAQRNPRLLSLLGNMKKLRDPYLHGDVLKDADHLSESLSSFRELARDIARLLPGVEVSASDQEAPDGGRFVGDDLYNRKLDAHNRLDKIFGYQQVRLMEDKLREQLVEIEIHKARWPDEEGEEVECSTVVNCLASALQITIHDVFMSNCDGQSLGRETHFETTTASERALEGGFKLEENRFSAILENVSPGRIKLASMGHTTSLGANLIALLIMAPGDWLSSLATRMPKFILQVQEILTLRGHGNRKQFKTVEKISRLIEESHTAIKQLKEA